MRACAVWLVLAVLAIGGGVPTASAQSGRNRDRQPQPQPQPQPPPSSRPPDPGPTQPPPEETAPPAPIPPGGLVASQTNARAVSRYVLRNGLKLLVRENPATRLASVRLTATNGGGDASSQRAALATRVRALGGSLEVDSSSDATRFAILVPADSAGAAIEAGAALFAPGASPAAPYAVERALLVVSGNVVAYDMLTAAQRAYGVYSETPAQTSAGAPAPPPPAAPARSAYQTSRGDSGVAVVTIDYPVPAGGVAEGPAVEVLAAALAEGWGSRLGRALRWTGLVTRVSSSYEWRGAESALAVRFEVDPKNLDAAEGAFFRETDRLRRERITDGELQRARNVFERSLLTRMATVEGESREIERFERQFGDVNAVASYLDRVRAVTSADVQRAAALYLSASRASVDELLPADAPSRTFTAKTYSETVATWAPNSSRDVAASEVRPAEGTPAVAEGRDRHRQGENEDAVILPVPLPVRDFSTLNGPKAIVREDQSRSLISVGLFYPSGRVAEAATERGVTELMLRSMLRGTRKYPSDKLMLAIEQLGGDVRIVDEPEFFGVVVEGLSRNADLLTPIAIELIERPTFDKEDVARERDVLLADIRRARSDAPARAADLFWQGRYPTHPYGMPALGASETVAKLTDEQVRSWYARSCRTQFPFVAIVGDTDGSSLVSRYVADGFDRGDGAAPPSPGLPAPAAPGDTAEARDRAATTQAIGFPGPAASNTALDAVEVATASVGVRSAAELASGVQTATVVSAHLERRRLASAALVTVTSSPADETRVRDLVLARFADTGSAPLSAADLATAQAAALRAGLDGRQLFTELLLDYVRAAAFGLPLDSVESYEERLRAVTADAVRKAAGAFNPQIGGRGVVRGR